MNFKNPFEIVKELALFLGTRSDDDFIHQVVESSSFDAMKESAQNSLGGEAAGHLRKGVSGDWKNHFTDELVQEFLDTPCRFLVDSIKIFPS